MAALAHLHHHSSFLTPQCNFRASLGPHVYARARAHTPFAFSFPRNSLTVPHFRSLTGSGVESGFRFDICCRVGGGGSGGGDGSGGGGDGGGGDEGSPDSSPSHFEGFGILGLFVNGWRSRVAADPQFAFKVLMEELVGLTACILGDMSSRPNFGLNELDFVFSTLVVGSILNFLLMYLLAPTAASALSSSTLPSIFAGCPASHMFEPGPYTFLNRLGTFAYKGAVFAAVGFGAGLVGTAISNGLILMRKRMDPSFETPNKPPPTLLNALTWAAHMGVSSNFRYQSLNGIEFVLAKRLPEAVFRSLVLVMRCSNNVLGGSSFVALARLTGSQSAVAKTRHIGDEPGEAKK